jgi:murein DD-endopeptidase MepM/ murein hydrolase activator NlpD
VTGSASESENHKIAVARLNGIGQLDNSFNGTGKLIINGPKDYSSAYSAAVVLLPGDDMVLCGQATSDDDDDVRQMMLARLHPDGTSDPTTFIPNGDGFKLDLLDFPFFTVWSKETFQGFDPKRTPARIDLELKFVELADPLRIEGVDLEVLESNANNFRFPLAELPAGKWRSNNSHEFSVHHSGSRSQRFAYDIGATIGLDPNCDYKSFIPNYAGNPNYDPDIPEADKASSYNECYGSEGQPIFAAAPGKVIFARGTIYENWPKGVENSVNPGGNMVIIDHLNGEFSRYFHMIRGSVLVSSNQMVTASTRLGSLGNSGQSTGPHEHFDIIDENGTGTEDGIPVYFNNVLFAGTSDGPIVRQLRTGIPNDTDFDVDTSAIPFGSNGTQYGPGAVDEIAGAHDSLSSPMRLRLPVSVQGAVNRNTGTSVADAGDVIEDVYRFSVSQSGIISAQLYFDGGADLDFIIYDQTLRPINPGVAKTLANPELFCMPVGQGTYYLFVTLYDRTAKAGSVSYRLNVDFRSEPKEIYINKLASCLVSAGNIVCADDYGGPFHSVLEGLNAACPGDRIFIRGTVTPYDEALTIRMPLEIRAYGNLDATINP